MSLKFICASKKTLSTNTSFLSFNISLLRNQNSNIVLKRNKTSSVPDRNYFYHIDVHGQLFLNETTPKNLTSCFKDKKFLNFFFKRLKFNDTNLFQPQYNFISPCGKEKNYIHSEDSPVVYNDLVDNGKSLVWAGDLLYPFDPNNIHVSSSSGRIYYPSPINIQANEKLNLYEFQGEISSYSKLNLALMKSSLVLSTFMDDLNMDEGTIKFQNQVYKLRFF